MTPEERQEHANLLRKAIEGTPGVTRQLVADATDRKYRTVGYWIAKKNPTMPSGPERAILRRLLGPYDSPGDAVEKAIRKSPLDDWRQDLVISHYKRNLQEQARESAREARTEDAG